MNEQSGNSGQLQGEEGLREAVHDAIGQALGDSYDCTRVWEAWQVGTMSQDDFSLITDDSNRMWEITDAVLAALAARQTVGHEPVAWQSMATCPRDGTVVILRWGDDHVSPGWWCAPTSPIQNEDGTWPTENGGFPWAFIDINNGSAFVNHAVDTEYGPTHWSLYTAPPTPAHVGQDRMAIKLLVAAGFVTEQKANESLRIAHGFGGDLGQPAPAAVPVGMQDIIGSMLNYAGVADTCEVTQGHAPIAIRNWAEMLQQLTAPAAVPVDGVGRRMIGDAIRSAYDAGYNDARNAQAKPGDSAPGYSGRTIESFHGEALSKSLSVIAGAAALLATHPQPAAAEQNANKGMADEYQEWIDFFHKGMGDYGDFLRNVVMPRVRQDDAPAAAGGDA
ncbi:hypothetical protein OM948_08595 [Xanthomonas citri pv. fuscans]|uniref:hypothetical protein n=1 Tax=Xanthomonas citri TaxID=346 RepID=UPI00222650DB|nr:hypothetical protein [Xanthomonas citri]UZB05495.1 hypothetical protein OM948_08595 [Xanthomonas citri pv. fuscans]